MEEEEEEEGNKSPEFSLVANLFDFSSSRHQNHMVIEINTTYFLVECHILLIAFTSTSFYQHFTKQLEIS